MTATITGYGDSLLDPRFHRGLRAEEKWPLRTRIHLLTILATLLGTEPGVSDERPLRSDCIIGYALDWTHVNTDQYEVRESMFDLLSMHGDAPKLAAMHLKIDGSEIYFQYLQQCEDKQKMASDLIVFWRSKGLDLPVFERLPDPIVPSPDTIDRRGPYWRDPPNPPRRLQDDLTDT